MTSFTPSQIRELIKRSDAVLKKAAWHGDELTEVEDLLSSQKDALEYLLQFIEWRPASEAPKDGTKVDFLYPYPRGRTIDCYWGDDSKLFGTGWIWRDPTWNAGEILPEAEWEISCYPNMKPMYFRLIPPPPEKP